MTPLFEGIVKYREEFVEGPSLSARIVKELSVWRTILFNLGLIGQDARRYGGAAFGNASMRLKPYDLAKGNRSFVITGSQTGGEADLSPAHFTVVESYDLKVNIVRVKGPIRASSEALTHGVVYDQMPTIRWVFHTHCPAIWARRDELAVPSTRPEVAYGTPELAEDVLRLFAHAGLREKRIFAMTGHQDGVVTFGGAAGETVGRMIEYMARAMLLET